MCSSTVTRALLHILAKPSCFQSNTEIMLLLFWYDMDKIISLMGHWGSSGMWWAQHTLAT